MPAAQTDMQPSDFEDKHWPLRDGLTPNQRRFLLNAIDAYETTKFRYWDEAGKCFYLDEEEAAAIEEFLVDQLRWIDDVAGIAYCVDERTIHTNG